VAEFVYKGRATDGKVVQGSASADTREQLAQRLITTGVTPIEIAAAKLVPQQSLQGLSRRLGLGKVRIADLVLFSRQMYTVTKSGIPLLRGLRGLASSTQNAILRETLEDVLANLEGGRDLSTSLGKHPQIFPSLYISIVRVGEATGTLERSFLRLTEYLTQEKDLNDRVKGAMRYPFIVVITIVLAAIFLSTYVIPKFEPIFAALQGNIPLPTRIVIGFSKLLRDYWHLTAGTVAASIFLVRRYVNTTEGRLLWDRSKLRVPVLGRLAYESALARTTRSLAISLSAGMPMTQSLQVIARSCGNQHLARKIADLGSLVERGESLSRAASASGLFTPLVLQMIGIGEETGELPELLDEAAGFYEREVDVAVKNLSASIEPMLIVGVGGMVLILALGIFMPMWEMIARASGH
jgi:MSHA biogenesis protein MshG